MYIDAITSETLAASVIAVPPVARNSRLKWNDDENIRMIRHLEAGGVTTLLYGGNAALAHVSLSEYASLLSLVADAVAPATVVVPSVGPQYGMMMDQAEILRDYAFPTVMLLPLRDGATPQGLATGIRGIVDRLERPIVLYIQYDDMIDAATVQRMSRDGLISWIKYGIVRDDPRRDPFLEGLVDAVGARLIVSGMGEQPAIVHMRDFGLVGFTSGCVCIAPELSMAMLSAIERKDFAEAERIRQKFVPLESLRDEISPVRVLHAAVRLAGIADTGPITPFWSLVNPADEPAIERAARELARWSSLANISQR
jgi:dihydrodipicolinate synthase/N-acetylneuraminate lyase